MMIMTVMTITMMLVTFMKMILKVIKLQVIRIVKATVEASGSNLMWKQKKMNRSKYKPVKPAAVTFPNN